MTNSCLSQIIGFRGCEQLTPPLAYFESLPGVSIKALDMIADDDQQNFIEVMDDLRFRAAQRVFVSMQKGANIKLQTFSDNFCVGRLDEPLNFVPATTTNNLQGIVFSLKQSKYLALDIHSLMFFSDIDKEITFFLIDLQSNSLITQFNYSLLAGENTIPVNKTVFPSRYSTKIFIAYDSFFSGYFQSKTQNCYDDCIDICGCSDNCCNDIYGWNGSLRSSDSYGLGVNYSVLCSFERLLCENSHLFVQALLYATGIEFIFELRGSSRINKFTTTKEADYTFLLNVFEERYKESIMAALNSINFCDDCCFECAGSVNYGYVTP